MCAECLKIKLTRIHVERWIKNYRARRQLLRWSGNADLLRQEEAHMDEQHIGWQCVWWLCINASWISSGREQLCLGWKARLHRWAWIYKASNWNIVSFWNVSITSDVGNEQPNYFSDARWSELYIYTRSACDKTDNAVTLHFPPPRALPPRCPLPLQFLRIDRFLPNTSLPTKWQVSGNKLSWQDTSELFRQQHAAGPVRNRILRRCEHWCSPGRRGMGSSGTSTACVRPRGHKKPALLVLLLQYIFIMKLGKAAVLRGL